MGWKGWLRVGGRGYQVSSIRYQVSGIKYQVSSIRYQVSGIKYQVSSIRYQVRGGLNRMNLLVIPHSLFLYQKVVRRMQAAFGQGGWGGN